MLNQIVTIDGVEYMLSKPMTKEPFGDAVLYCHTCGKAAMHHRQGCDTYVAKDGKTYTRQIYQCSVCQTTRYYG